MGGELRGAFFEDGEDWDCGGVFGGPTAGCGTVDFEVEFGGEFGGVGGD